MMDANGNDWREEVERPREEEGQRTYTPASPGHCSRRPSPYGRLAESYGGEYRAEPSVWMHLTLQRPPPPPPPPPFPSLSRSSSSNQEGKSYTEFYVIPQLVERRVEEEVAAPPLQGRREEETSPVSGAGEAGLDEGEGEGAYLDHFLRGPPLSSSSFYSSSVASTTRAERHRGGIGGYTSATAVLSFLTATPSAFQVDLLATPPELAAAIHLRQLDHVEYERCDVVSSTGKSTAGAEKGGGKPPTTSTPRPKDFTEEPPSRSLFSSPSARSSFFPVDGAATANEEPFLRSQVNGRWQEGFRW